MSIGNFCKTHIEDLMGIATVSSAIVGAYLGYQSVPSEKVMLTNIANNRYAPSHSLNKRSIVHLTAAAACGAGYFAYHYKAGSTDHFDNFFFAITPLAFGYMLHLASYLYHFNPRLDKAYITHLQTQNIFLINQIALLQQINQNNLRIIALLDSLTRE